MTENLPEVLAENNIRLKGAFLKAAGQPRPSATQCQEARTRADQPVSHDR